MAYNINGFSIRELLDRGVARVSLPTIAVQTMIAALKKNLKIIHDTGSFSELMQGESLCRFDDIASLMKQ
ncbi:hypothetical protein SDC9_133364 [bioreactor metagenome]|uniref:Uncharacterized protein n=1 Tax=bioreactor metagenome TaxID=1076179 RepID=A0A645DAL4_9ZZZZ